MKAVIIVIFALYSSVSSALTQEQATKYLKSVGCQFGVVLKTDSGRMMDVGLCFESRHEGGAVKHKYCVMNPINLKEGVYTDAPERHDRRRFEGEYCSKKAITEILNRGYANQALGTMFAMANAPENVNSKLPEWIITEDKHSVASIFKDKYQYKPKK